MDKYIETNPDTIRDFDPELVALVDELVEGVEI